MTCSGCMPSELIYQLRLTGEKNLEVFSKIQPFLQSELHFEPIKNDVLYIRESKLIDFLDFSKDHMDIETMTFRIGNGNWRLIEDIDIPLEKQWVDDIIFKNTVVSYAQPIVDANKDIYAYEVLSRFKNEEGELISPGAVFSAARTRNRLYALDRMCRMNAVRQAPLLQTKLFINFIPTAIYSPEHCLVSTIDLAYELGIDPKELVFEVVETDKVNDVGHLKGILQFYEERGFEYALDDVGEGFNTARMLSDIRPHYMKLDIKYVQGVAEDLSKQEMAQQFLRHSLSVGAIPLAEGVELEEDFIWLRNQGYQLFQGYYFGKPEPVEKVALSKI